MRSLMFVPGHRERMVQRALGLGEFRVGPLDVAILDLEDGVPAGSKAEACRIVADALGRRSQGGAGPLRYVRIRRALSDDGASDLDAIVRPGLDGLMAPKVRRADEVAWLAEELDARERDAKLAARTVRIVPSIESAAALLEAPSIARASDRVMGLAFGSEDYALDLGLPTTREGEALDLLYARSATVVAAAAAHRLAFDGIFPDISDIAGLRADSLRARRLGFAGKTLVHPDQIETVNRIFSPAPEEIEHARRVVAAYDDGIRRGVGAVALEGQMLDAPVVDRARRMLRAHGRTP
ncbi:MAG TPA: CoA ester lyase [Candidatus Limnocylindria bacterium]|jgi:citrate lyase beta subunit|nr:CoA ester lyase [Candidatus Limnocylindria bacterium]